VSLLSPFNVSKKITWSSYLHEICSRFKPYLFIILLNQIKLVKIPDTHGGSQYCKQEKANTRRDSIFNKISHLLKIFKIINFFVIEYRKLFELIKICRLKLLLQERELQTNRKIIVEGKKFLPYNVNA